MQKLAIIGYGRMGRLIDEMAADYGFLVVSRIDPGLGTRICAADLQEADLAIEFTEPKAAAGNISQLLALGVKVVCGTTGWQDNLEQVREEVEKSGGGLVYGANFSLGMNLFYKIVSAAAEVMSKAGEYDVYGYELHHRRKKDSPSGTAKQLVSILLERYSGKEQGVYDRLQRQREDNEIHFGSIRGGEIPGEHRVGFDSEFDSIELKHVMRNRKGLAAGALKAAQFISTRKGFYAFEDILGEL